MSTTETATDAPASEDFVHWSQIAARAADDKLAINTLIVDVAEVLAVTDVFLITAGNNPRQVRAIANNIEAMVVRAGGPRLVRKEGHDTFEWVLLDFGGFICHVFEVEHRAYYELERLWGDRPRIEWAPNEPTEIDAAELHPDEETSEEE